MCAKSLHRNLSAGKGRAAPLSSGASFDARFERYHDPRTTRPENTANWNLRHVIPAQSRRKRHTREYRVSIHADLMKITSNDAQRGIPGKNPSQSHASTIPALFPYGGVIPINLPYNPNSTRGLVTGFSQASRRRMIQLMASIRIPGSMLFVTLTYADDVIIRGEDEYKKHFEALRRRFERNYPTYSAIWRVEDKARKSGEIIGTVVPHYHLIVFTDTALEGLSLDRCSTDFHTWLNQAWHEITGSQDDNHLTYGCTVSPVRSRKHAYSYVSKYIAKRESDIDSVGRRWGRIGQFDTSVGETFFIDTDELIVLKRIVKKWLNKQATARHQAKQRARKNPVKPNAKKRVKMCDHWTFNLLGQGITVLSLGDTDEFGQSRGLNPPYAQLITEAIRQVRDRRANERGYGD